VPFHERVSGPAVRLAPHELDLRAELQVGLVDHREGDPAPDVRRVAGQRRYAGQPAVLLDAVDVGAAVEGRWHLDVLEPLVARLVHAGEDLRDVVPIPEQPDLPPVRLRRQALQRVTADELVVELEDLPVAEVPRGDVQVLGPVGHVAAC